MEAFEPVYTAKKRKSLISAEVKKLTEIFQKLEQSTYDSAIGLIKNAAFLAVTLEELRLIITRDGPVEPYQNGENQKGLKKSAAVEAYDKLLNTYAKVIKQLVEMLPKTVRLINEDGEDTLEEVEDDSALALMAYVQGFKR